MHQSNISIPPRLDRNAPNVNNRLSNVVDVAQAAVDDARAPAFLVLPMNWTPSARGSRRLPFVSGEQRGATDERHFSALHLR